MTFEQDDTRGLTQREILLEVRKDVKNHVEEYQEDKVEVALAFGRRPTRAEVISWAGGIGAIVGVTVALIT